MKNYWILLILIIASSCNGGKTHEVQNSKLRALILDGQNNHYIWPKTTMMMKNYLEQTGLFEVDINRTDTLWLGIKYNQDRAMPLGGYIKEFPSDSTARVISADHVKTSNFSIDFSKYDLIVSNLGALTPNWPDKTKRNFENYMNEGGGLVVVHAANNAWGDWDEFNNMIGLGAWGDRDSISGPYAYYNDDGNIEVNPSEGIGGSHGQEQEFVITTRAPEHPIMKDLPLEWLHTQDELYDRMRGPFENATILATAYSDVEKNEQPWEPRLKGSGWNVPMLMAINYGQGRIFHSTLGHFDYSMECVGFITTLQRGAEWAATGEVFQEVPADFPSKEKTSSRNLK
jgi:hypothetical protein